MSGGGWCEVHVLVPQVGGGAVLAPESSRRRPALPVVRLPGEAGERTAAILDGIREATPFEWLLGIQDLEATAHGRTTLALVEAEAAAVAPAGYDWAPADAVLSGTRSEAVRVAAERSLRALATTGEEASAPWFAPGWRSRTTAWTADRLAARGRVMTRQPRVVHAGPVSVVQRVETDTGPVFHKASIRHFAQEAAVLEALGLRTPGWVPETLAADPAMGVLMAPMGGRELADDPPRTWGRGLRRLAELQLAWAGHVPELLAAGAPPRDLRELASRVEAMGDVFDALVRLEPDVWPAWSELAAALRERILLLHASPIPTTVVHGDLHPGNIQVDGETVRLFDWSDGAISHPFVDLAVYLRHLATPPERRRMLDAYLGPWSAGFERSDLERAASVAPTVGAVYQVATYLALVPALDPRDRWQYEDAAPRWLRSALRPIEVAPARPGRGAGPSD